jgi:hypothetical protein
VAIVYKKAKSMLGYLHHDNNKKNRNPGRALSCSGASQSCFPFVEILSSVRCGTSLHWFYA